MSDEGKTETPAPAQHQQQQVPQFSVDTSALSTAYANFCRVTGTISPQGLLPRNPDGSCAAGQPSLHEVDMVAFSGTLSF